MEDATMAVKPIPEGAHRVTPYLCCRDTAGAIDFYTKVFGATEVMRLVAPNGKVGHAEIKIGKCVLMLSDEYPEMDVKSPQTLGGTPVTIHLYVEDVDATVERAVAAGAKLTRPVADQFYGDRSGQIVDPSGHRWHVATHIEDVAPDELSRRHDALYGSSR
jgi:PhnB protein